MADKNKQTVLKGKGYAKVNLYLDIVGVRKDGYHDIQSIMHRIDLCDEVEIAVCEGESFIRVKIDRPELPCDERNIAIKAAKAYLKATDNENIRIGLDITIKKRIPIEAGLGGSSADGAAVLVLLNRYFGEHLNIDELCEIGGKIGADLPFCIKGGTAVCTGIGEQIAPIKAVESHFLIVKPPFGMNTALAYRKFDTAPKIPHNQMENLVEKINEGDFFSGTAYMYNIFQQLADSRESEQLEKIGTQLTRLGAKAAMLSGSGSSMFGVFESENEVQRALQKASELFKKTDGYELFVAKSC